MSDTTTPSLAEVIQQAIGFHFSGVFTGTIARVLSYDATKKRASLQPIIQERYRDERGEIQLRSLPVMEDVPVILPGSGGTRIKFPVSVGDTVLVVFLSQSSDQWRVKGGNTVDPGDDRRNTVSDAVCIPNLQSFKNAGDAATFIEFTNTEIKAGGAGPLVTKAEFDSFVTTKYNLHTHIAGGGTSTVPSLLGAAIAGTAQLRGSVAMVLMILLNVFLLGWMMGHYLG